MKLNVFLFVLLTLGIVFSANHEYKLYDRYYEDDGSSKFNIKVDLEGSRGTNIDVCEGENNPNSFIDKAITYENMEIISFCNSVVGLTGNEGQYMCGSGYDTTTSTSSTLTTGVVVGTDNNGRKDVFDKFVSKTFRSSNSAFNKYLINNGAALLSKFPRLASQTPINVNRAKAKVGVGCLGEYNYILEKEILYISPSGEIGYTWKIDDEFNGGLDGAGKSYEFEKDVKYRIVYSATVRECFTLMEEKYSTAYLIHLFKDKIVNPTVKSDTKTIMINVVSGQGPDYNVYGEGATCGIYGTPVQLTKGETVNVVTFVKIINDYSVPITISEMNANYFKPGLFFPQPTGDIEIGSITTNIKLPLTIQPGSERTIRVTIPSKIKDSVTNPLDNYNLRVAFDYSYSDHPQKCYLGKSSVGLCNELITVSVVDDPPILYTLNANVKYEENIIDRKFIEEEKNTVNIFGRVNLTTNDGKVQPTITTEWIGGADVELVSLQIQGTNIDCLKTKGLKTKTAQLNAPPYSYTGNYRFNNVELNAACLEYDIIDSLVAGIKVDYTTDDGTALTTSSHGQIPVNTALGILTCDLNYKLTSSNYRPGEGEEEYLITITVENQYKDPEVIEYKCGNEEGEDWKTTTEDEFECAYEFDSVNPEDVIYIAQARVKDDIMEGREAVCNANIGLCLPYV